MSLQQTDRGATGRRFTAIGRQGVLLLLCCCLSWPVLARQLNYPFTLETERDDGGHRIVAVNRGPVPVSVRVDLSQQLETASDRTFPYSAVIPADTREVLAHIRPALPGHGYQFKTEASWTPGDFLAKPNEQASYRLPWPDGLAFRVSQAADGPIRTHNTPNSRYALDVPMPEGTPIVAARAGVVLDAEEDESEGGTTPEMLKRSNAIRILHDDGSIAVYAHLAFRGVFVKPGQPVEAGERIGLSGSTGYSSGPHLHFAVLKVEKTEQGFDTVSLPFRFRIGNPAITFTPGYAQVLVSREDQAGEVPMVRAHQVQMAPVEEEDKLTELLLIWAAGLVLVILIVVVFAFSLSRPRRRR